MYLALEEPDNDDISFEIDSMKFFIAKWALPYTEGATLDYISDERGEGFFATLDKKWFEPCFDDDW